MGDAGDFMKRNGKPGKGKSLKVPPQVLKGLKTIKKKKKLGSSMMGPNLAMQRLLIAKLSNLNAIPDAYSSPTPTSNGGGTPSPTPESETVEMVTQAGDILQTQAGEDLITQ